MAAAAVCVHDAKRGRSTRLLSDTFRSRRRAGDKGGDGSLRLAAPVRTKVPGELSSQNLAVTQKTTAIP
jgi:hypothetical protein